MWLFPFNHDGVQKSTLPPERANAPTGDTRLRNWELDSLSVLRRKSLPLRWQRAYDLALLVEQGRAEYLGGPMG